MPEEVMTIQNIILNRKILIKTKILNFTIFVDRRDISVVERSYRGSIPGRDRPR